MKTIVVTGSANGFGLALLKEFRMKNYNTVICDISKESILNAEKELNKIKSNGKILSIEADITKSNDISNLIDKTIISFNEIDIWINNAGVNQPNKPIWEIDEETIDRLIDIDLKGTILCTNLIMKQMIKQNHGQIFNVEGYGSNDAKMLGLSLYGTSKRAVTYFTEAMAIECMSTNSNVLIGKISPGIMITDFIHKSKANNEKIELDEKTKKVYNILGDYPDVIAHYMANKIDNNKKNNVKFSWLTNTKASFRFMTSMFNKRNFFK